MANCFISYARRPLDERVLAHVVHLLGRAGVSYWWDGLLDHKEGAGLNDEVSRHIAAADVVLVLASSQSLSSDYCQAEIVRSLQTDKRVVRIDVEPYSHLPHPLLPLASVPAVAWDERAPHVFASRLAEALAACGIDIHRAAAPLAEGAAPHPIDNPNATLIRPKYRELRGMGADTWRKCVQRVNQATALNPQNGYNHLSLAFLWLYSRDPARSLDSARVALGLLAREPDAHYAEALALCIQGPAIKRSRSEAEAILRRLAAARALPGAGAHIDLLSALVIANYYLPKYIPPPAAPDALLRRGLEVCERQDLDENVRVLDLEPIVNPAYSPQPELWSPYFQEK
jgi:hypothetical protein